MRKQEMKPFPLICSLLICTFLFLLPGKSAPPAITLAFTGDVMLGRGVAQALDGDWEGAFVDVRPWLADADLTFANLESPLTTAPQIGAGYDLRALPESVAALRAAGFDVVSLANNHTLDAGQAGLRKTADTLHAAGISALLDWKAGGLVDCSPTYQLLAFDDSVAPLDMQAAAGRVAAAAEQADVVVVSIHWGGEYQAAPGPRQQAVARALAEAGAGIIIGHGTHVLQRIEWIGETLVTYSLGNLLFDQPYPADCRQGVILRVTLQGNRIAAVEAIPTVTEHGRVRLASPKEAAAISNRIGLDTNIIQEREQ